MVKFVGLLCSTGDTFFFFPMPNRSPKNRLISLTPLLMSLTALLKLVLNQFPAAFQLIRAALAIAAPKPFCFQGFKPGLPDFYNHYFSLSIVIEKSRLSGISNSFLFNKNSSCVNGPILFSSREAFILSLIGIM